MKLIYKNFFYKFLIYSLLLISLNACSGRISNHGVLNIEKIITTVIERKLEKAEVEALLGPPSTISAFEFNKWYYINAFVISFCCHQYYNFFTKTTNYDATTIICHYYFLISNCNLNFCFFSLQLRFVHKVRSPYLINRIDK